MEFQLLTVSDSFFLSLFPAAFSLFKYCYNFFIFICFFRFCFAFGFCLLQFVLFYWMANSSQASVRKEARQKRMTSFQFIVFTIHNIIFSIRSLPLFRDDEFAFRFCVQNIYSGILFHFDYCGRVVMGRWIDGVGCCSCCYLFFFFQIFILIENSHWILCSQFAIFYIYLSICQLRYSRILMHTALLSCTFHIDNWVQSSFNRISLANRLVFNFFANSVVLFLLFFIFARFFLLFSLHSVINQQPAAISAIEIHRKLLFDYECFLFVVFRFFFIFFIIISFNCHQYELDAHFHKSKMNI